jgi:cell division protein FtsW
VSGSGRAVLPGSEQGRGAGVPPPRQGSRGGAARRTVTALLDTPVSSYYLITGASVALIGIGLVMVLSSSSMESLAGGKGAFAVFGKQAMFAALGLPAMVLASRIPPATWAVVAWPLLVVSMLCQLLVFTPLGIAVNGNRNWISVAGMTMQPAELAKFALVIWAATVLARKRPLIDQPAHALVPVLPAAGLLLLLVLRGHDLGTALVLMALVGTVLFVAGAPLRIFAAGFTGTAVLVLVLVTSSSNRMGRISTWLSGSCTEEQIYNSCWQTMHGKFALATGGWVGVGLGASREKWGLLPEAHNDFIFAVLGEELGLIGTLLVLALFALLALGLFRVVRRSDDLFVKIATAGVLTWIIGQAVINIGAVVGLLPVVGVPLPLVSSGGSALVMAMIALGTVIGFARREPGAPEAFAARAGLVRRSLAVLPVRQRAGSRPGAGSRP